MKSVVTFLEKARVARKQVCENLTVFPLISSEELVPYYLTLEEAIDNR